MGSTTGANDILLGAGVEGIGGVEGDRGSLILGFLSWFSDSLRLEEDILCRTSAGDMIVSGGAGLLVPSELPFLRGLISSLCSRA